MAKFKIKKSRMWIPALGIVIAYGFLHNCIIVPFTTFKTVDWTNLILAFSILIGLGGSRDVVLRKFSYLKDYALNNPKRAKGFFTNKIWIPSIGWCLVGGFAVNFIVSPYTTCNEVEWSGLMAALSILLTVSGFRDYGLCSQEHKLQQGQKAQEKLQE